jgi:hypothetical protein
MSKKDYKKKVVEYVRSTKPRSTAHRILSQDEYLDGVIIQIEYSDNNSSVKEWIVFTGKHKGYADSESQLIQQMNNASDKYSKKWDWLNQIFNMGGFIALILVGTASYLTLSKGVSDIPEYLKASLLTIVGFYFGGLVYQSKNKKIDEES